MSETTTDPTVGNAGNEAVDAFAESDAEPSMEDILASIRKIIADDADPVPFDGPVSEQADLPVSLVEPTEAVADENDVAGETDSEAETDLDIEALLTEMDVIEPEPAMSSHGDADLSLEDALVIPDPDPVDSPQGEAVSVDPLSETAAQPTNIDKIDVSSDLDDMDRLMDELLVGLDRDIPSADPVIDTRPVDENTDDNVSFVTTDAAQIDGDDELDMVKSLMADLTDEDVVRPDPVSAQVHAQVETESVHTAEVGMTAVSTDDSLGEAEADLAIPPEPQSDELEDDILDSILNMTLEDEIAALEKQVQTDAEQPHDATIPHEIADQAGTSQMDRDDGPTLAEIAAAADADAAPVEAVPEPAQTTDMRDEPVASDDQGVDAEIAVGAASAALLGGATRAASEQPVDDVPMRQDTSDETNISADAATPISNTPEVETPMQRAVRADAILDDVTEEAAMSAFAELNNVVEEKAVFEERGPRIGDLVQEALKPMLKDWLDANLKGIVERAVAKEVKRIATGK